MGDKELVVYLMFFRYKFRFSTLVNLYHNRISCGCGEEYFWPPKMRSGSNYIYHLFVSYFSNKYDDVKDRVVFIIDFLDKHIHER